MKTLTKGHLEAIIEGSKIIVEDSKQGVITVYPYPWHQTEESALEYILNKHQLKGK